MIQFLLFNAGFLNLMFYVFAIGCAISFILEQFVKDNERSLYIVQTNRKYCWRQAWITNVLWFMCNLGFDSVYELRKFLCDRKYDTNCDKDIGCTFDYIKHIKWFFEIEE